MFKVLNIALLTKHTWLRNPLPRLTSLIPFKTLCASWAYNLLTQHFVSWAGRQQENTLPGLKVCHARAPVQSCTRKYPGHTHLWGESGSGPMLSHMNIFLSMTLWSSHALKFILLDHISSRLEMGAKSCCCHHGAEHKKQQITKSFAQSHGNIR